MQITHENTCRREPAGSSLPPQPPCVRGDPLLRVMVASPFWPASSPRPIIASLPSPIFATRRSANGAHQADPVNLPLAKPGVVLHHDFQRQLFEVREPSYEAYRIVEMVVHSGLFVHQIAPMRDLQPDDERITFQGHSIWRATDGISIGDLRRGFRTSGHSLGAAFRPQRPLDREVFVMLHATLVAERSLAAKLPSRG